jgi:spermidine synthase
MFATGLTAAAAQIVFLREYLSIFSGNELVIGVILAFWLLATAAGSYAGNRFELNNPRNPRNPRLLSFLYVFSIILGLLLLRASRLLFQPGEVIPPWYIPLIVLLTQSDAAFFGGFTFGRLARRGNGGRVYLMENAGAVAGLLFLSLCILLYGSNGAVIAGAMAFFAIVAFWPHRGLLTDRKSTFIYYAGSGLLIVIFLVIDPISVHWKYGHNVDKVVNGCEGEIALSRGGAVFLNNTLYRAGMALPSIEQAVHLPAAMHTGPLHRALVICNAGHVLQLRKYGDLPVECLETEPFLATGGCTCGTVETMSKNRSFDLVLLGSGMPATGAANRFHTLNFYKKMRVLTGDSGVFSFTLPLSENFLSPQERRIKDLLQVTLSRAFRHVLVVPGEGFTFIASDKPLPWPVKPVVRTEYLESFILASITPERVREANMLSDSLRTNTINRPSVMLLAQKQWLGLFGVPLFSFLGVLALMLVVAIAVSPRTRPAFSVGTTGFTTGVYSVALMLIYQFFHGTLYSRISVLMIALTIGFVLGSRMKRFVFSDGAIGLYAAVTLIILITVSFPPLALFCVFHAGIGFLSGAQFVTRKGTSWGGLYAADLAGGVFGMALCSTLFVPCFGVTTVAIGLGLLKLAGELITAG